ncbi:DUF4030 domain-containing protein [Radiobacillus kanasensis]|uniref:DUF4030 domain-containing protein n=1 Tax=Radiobacillus kanasensis TaxID=2844358 RepID=UPI001E5B9AE9|nr:DUF4030 domain-containing protein [Radiobacillus kanasensis]UFT98964.1 DUF4030 domain-containing protein [Radiobacillus kanasensis]
MNNSLEKEIERIEIPDELSDYSRKGVLQARKEMKKPFYTRKSILASAIIILLVASSLLSPTVTNVLADVPFLKQFFHNEPITLLIEKELKGQGYDIEEVEESSYPDKIMYVQVNGSEQDVQEVRQSIEAKTEEILLDEDYDAFSVVVEKYEEREFRMSEESEQYAKEAKQIMDAVSEKMKETDVNLLTMGVTHNQKDHKVEIAVPDTTKNVDELKQMMKEVVEPLGLGTFFYKVQLVNLKQQELEMKVTTIINTLHEGLRAKKEFHTKGMAYSFHPPPLQIVVKTTLDSKDPQADEVVERIESHVMEFFHTEEVEKILKDVPYELVIRSADQVQLNK